MLILSVVELAAIVVLAVLVAGLLRSHAQILRRLHELGAGLEDEHAHGDFRIAGRDLADEGGDAHDLEGLTLAEEDVVIPVSAVDHRTLLAFLSSGCLTCRPFWEAFSSPSLELPGDVRLVVVVDETSDSIPEIARLAPSDVPVVLGAEAWRHYHVPGSPYFVLVDGPAGRVAGEGSATSWDQLLDLVGRAERGLRGSAGLERERRADRELRRAGIHPGHPSLHGGENEEEGSGE